MNKLEAMTIRKAILGWRERWTKNVGERLQADSLDLLRVLDDEIEAMSFRNAIFSKRYIRNKLQPIFVSWSKSMASELISDAEADLLKICQQSVPRHSAYTSLDAHDSVDDLKDMAGATLSSAMALAAIPAVVTFSTATVSVGGILGFLGVTASVILFKQLALGFFALAFLWSLATFRVQKIKTNCQARLKHQMQQQIKYKILYCKKNKSLNLTLNELIEETANKLIGELKNAR
ncbi:hypothetical protein D3C84_618050 [compost metagenome]